MKEVSRIGSAFRAWRAARARSITKKPIKPIERTDNPIIVNNQIRRDLRRGTIAAVSELAKGEVDMVVPAVGEMVEIWVYVFGVDLGLLVP